MKRNSTENVIDVLNWYKKESQEASKLQILLAVEYLGMYNYPVDIACRLALESYRI